MEGHCIIVPTEHVASTRQVDDHICTEMRNFKKCVLQMYMAQVPAAFLFFLPCLFLIPVDVHGSGICCLPLLPALLPLLPASILHMYMALEPASFLFFVPRFFFFQSCGGTAVLQCCCKKVCDCYKAPGLAEAAMYSRAW